MMPSGQPSSSTAVSALWITIKANIAVAVTATVGVLVVLFEQTGRALKPLIVVPLRTAVAAFKRRRR